MSRSPFVLAVDGGGSGCRAVLADRAGRILGRGAAGPANIATDLVTARENILAAATQASAGQAGMAEISATLGLAGANVPGLATDLAASLPFAGVRVVSDAVISVVGALGRGDGVVAALGTGSVFARQRDGVVQTIGGWGLRLGDEGSGAWLGRALLSRTLRAVDGFVPLTPLLQQILDDHGGTEGIINFAATAQPADFARLVPRLMTSDDPAALATLDQADTDIVAAIDLALSGAALPVVFIGGLGPAFASRLAGRWPLHDPKGSALDGALIMALEGSAGA
jgi:glucosamine kinase